MIKYFLYLNTLNINTNICNNIFDNVSISQCLFKNSTYVYFYSGYNLGLKLQNIFANIKLYQLKNKYCSMNLTFNTTLNTKFQVDIFMYCSIKHINHNF